MWRIHLGTNNEVFKPELYVISEVLEIALRGGRVGRGGASQRVTLSCVKNYDNTVIAATE